MENKEQIRSIAVSFSEFIIKEMITKGAITSEFDLIMLAEYYDKLIKKFIKGDDKNDEKRNN